VTEELQYYLILMILIVPFFYSNFTAIMLDRGEKVDKKDFLTPISTTS
jgi:hypothetical protein